jgi:hypothetical protein
MKPKLAIATAFGGRPVIPQWHIAMQNLQQPRNSIHVWLHVLGQKMDDAYNALAQQSLDLGAEYTMFVDDDVQIPPTTLVELLRVLENAEPDVMAAGAVCTTRQEPPQPLVFQSFGGGTFWKWKLGDIFPCYAVGSGAMMVRNEAFLRMEKPWFKQIRTIEELNDYPGLFEPEEMATLEEISVDFFFCQKLAKAGFKVMAHGGILPIHWSPEGIPYWMPAGSYPTRGVEVNGKEFGWKESVPV